MSAPTTGGPGAGSYDGRQNSPRGDPPELPGTGRPSLGISASTLVRAALGIAGITVLARLVGAARTLVLARTVGSSCLGDAYSTANTVPNVVFEVVAGGALAALVVPLLAPAVAAGDRDAVRRTVAALLTWTVLVLTPVLIVGIVLAVPILRVLSGAGTAGCDGPEQVALGARLLAVFMPQVLLYGLGAVLVGVLHSYRRFLGPAVAPLLSSLVVIGAYLAYAGLDTGGELTRGEELVLGVGTTAGVAALTLPLLVPLRRTGLRIPLRPTLSFPPGGAAAARRLAGAGIAGLAAQQLSVAVVLRLANDGAPQGSVVVYTLAWTVFLLPWAVLAVPIATSAYPAMAAQAAAGDGTGYAETTRTAFRALLLVLLGAAALLVAVAQPLARVLVLGAPGRPSSDALALGVAAFAPGLVGYGVLALLTRALYAQDRGRQAAAATVAGWLVVVVADVALAVALPPTHRVFALGLGNSVGMTVAALLLARAVRRAGAGSALVLGPRAGGAGLLSAAAAAAAGAAVAVALGPSGVAGSLSQCLLVGTVVALVYGVLLLTLDRAGTRAALSPLRAGRARG